MLAPTHHASFSPFPVTSAHLAKARCHSWEARCHSWGPCHTQAGLLLLPGVSSLTSAPLLRAGPPFGFQLNSCRGSTNLASRNGPHAPTFPQPLCAPAPSSSLRPSGAWSQYLADHCIVFLPPPRTASSQKVASASDLHLAGPPPPPGRSAHSFPTCLMNWLNKLIWGSFSSFLPEWGSCLPDPWGRLAH